MCTNFDKCYHHALNTTVNEQTFLCALVSIKGGGLDAKCLGNVTVIFMYKLADLRSGLLSCVGARLIMHSAIELELHLYKLVFS